MNLPVHTNSKCYCMVSINQNLEFILVINLGSTETSVTYYDCRSHNKMNLEILSGLKVIKSAVAIIKQEGRKTISIGEQAIQNLSLAEDWQIGFKKCLSEMNSSEWSDMATFIKGVYAEIINNNPEFNTRPHAVHIATTLSEKIFEIEKCNYLSIANKARLPLARIINTPKSINQNTEFIIGIDFGSTETSATLYDLRSKLTYNIEIMPCLKVITSAVAILEQEGTETICVGDAAILNAPDAKDFQISFKNRPSEMNNAERGRMVAFMKGVYAEILNMHPHFKTCAHTIYLSGPSCFIYFSVEEIEYLKIAEDAGLPVGGIISTMKAASYLFENHIAPNNEGRAIIADFGGNTIDLVYIGDKRKHQYPITMECTLGASEVEKALLRYAMENPSDEHMVEFARLYGKDERTIPYNSMLNEFRKAKEDFYGKKLPNFRVVFDYFMFTYNEKTPIDGISGVFIPREKIKDILGENRVDGYIWKVKEVIKSFKEKISTDNKVDYVYLIGGGSKMDFIKQIFEEIFNLDNTHCLTDNNPSLVVSQGVVQLAYAQYVDSVKEKH